MATSQSITKNVLQNASFSQIYLWSQETFENIDNFQYMNEQEFTSTYMDFTSKSLENPEIYGKNKIFEELKKSLIIGEYSHEQFLFILFDASVLWNNDINDMLYNIKNTKNFSNKKIIIITTDTNNAENTFKIVNQHKEQYANIDFTILEQNMNYLVVDSENVNMIDSLDETVLKFPKEWEFDFIHKHLLEYYKYNNRMLSGIKNQMNDNIQVDILQSLLELMPGSSGILYTNDGGIMQTIDNIVQYDNSNMIIFSTKKYKPDFLSYETKFNSF